MKTNYMKLCQPHWVKTDPEIFYGFWGSCFNSYRYTDPHDGYKIVKQWKEKYFANKEISKQIQENVKVNYKN